MRATPKTNLQENSLKTYLSPHRAGSTNCILNNTYLLFQNKFGARITSSLNNKHLISERISQTLTHYYPKPTIAKKEPEDNRVVGRTEPFFVIPPPLKAISPTK